jgi:hypothetical protein
LHNPKLLQTLHSRLSISVLQLDYPTYMMKVAEVASRLSQVRIEESLRSRDVRRSLIGEEPGKAREFRERNEGKSRKTRRPLLKPRELTPAGKARLDLQIKMLGAIPLRTRGSFLREVAEQALKYPSSARYLRQLADKGNDLAQQVVAMFGGVP